MNKKEDLRDIHTGITCAIGFSLVSLCFSIYIICNGFPRTETEFDYLGLIVGILAFITALLIGWQIALTFISRQQLKEMDEKINKTIYQNLYNVFSIQASVEDSQNQWDGALNYYFRCMDCSVRGELAYEAAKIKERILTLIQDPQQIEINQHDAVAYREITLNCMAKTYITCAEKDSILNALNMMSSETAPEHSPLWTNTSMTLPTIPQ